MDGEMESAMVYKDNHHVNVPAHSIDEAFVARVAGFMRRMTSDMRRRRGASLPSAVSAS